MPDEATTSLRTHLSGPCLCNDQPLTVYVAASPLLSHSRFSLSLPFAPLLSASQPPLSRAGCLALLVSLCLSGSACLALLVSLCLSRSASSLCLSRTLPRSICLALPLALSVSHWLSRSGCLALPVLHCLPALSVPRCLSGSCCPALSVPRCLSGYACLALSVWLCLSRSACFALPVWLCLSRSAHLALPVWLCSALTQHTHPVCCRTTRDERQLAHKGMHPLSLSAHSHTLSAHILSVVSHAAHILPAVYEYTGVSALCVHHNFLFPRINPLFSFFSLIVQR